LKKINTLIGTILLLFGLTLSLQAQVKGLSYTLSPSVEYNLFDEESGIANGYLGGAQLGIGFGQLVELRGLYLRGVNLNTDINRFGVDVGEGIDTSFMGSPLDLERYGAEIKLNIGRNALSPFIVAGTGIQSIGIEGEDTNKQIYLSGGLGLQLALADRFTITLQGLRNSYRSNAVQQLLGEDELGVLGLDPADFDDTDYSSWAGRASLLLYLGGERPGTYTETDRAYANKFKRGFSLAIEPTVNRINFNESLPFRDAYLAGAFVGFDFGPMIGVRAFYMHALEEGSRTKFDNLALIGGEARFRLGDNKGLTPFLSLGGGQIRLGDDYEGTGNGTLANQAFASGGAGINLSLGRIGNLTAYGRSMLTSNKEIGEISSVDAITNSWSYGLSLNLLVGGNSESQDEYRFTDEGDSDEMREMNKELDKLDRELDKAIRNQDRNEVMSISKEREIALQRRSLIEDSYYNNSEPSDEKQEKVENNIRTIKDMSDEEFMDMMDKRDAAYSRSYEDKKQDNRDQNDNVDVQAEIDRILKKRDDEERNRRSDDEMKELRKELDDLYNNRKEPDSNQRSNSDLQDQIDDLNRSINDIKNQERERSEKSRREKEKEAYSNEMKELRQELKELRERDRNSNRNDFSSDEMRELRRELRELRDGQSYRSPDRNDSGSESREVRELRKELRELRDRRDGQYYRSPDNDSSGESREVRELRKELKELREQRDGQSNRSSDSDSGGEFREVRELRKELKELREGNNDDGKSSESDRMIEDLQKEIEELRDRQSKGASRNNNQSQVRMKQIRTEIDKITSEMEMIDDKNSTEAKILKSETDKLKNELKRLQNQASNSQSKDRAMDGEDLSEYIEGEEAYWYLEPNSPRARSIFKSDDEAKGILNKLRYNGASGIAGFSFGGNGSLNVGYRVHYVIDGKKNLEFMPETYFGFGSPSNFGILANLNYHLRGVNQFNKKGLKPYIGAGAGIIKTGSDDDSDQIRPVINLLAGTALDVWKGKLYVDFSTRNFLKYNQIVGGYKFPF